MFDWENVKNIMIDKRNELPKIENLTLSAHPPMIFNIDLTQTKIENNWRCLFDLLGPSIITLNLFDLWFLGFRNSDNLGLFDAMGAHLHSVTSLKLSKLCVCFFFVCVSVCVFVFVFVCLFLGV